MYVCVCAPLCPTLCYPMACSPLGSSVHGDSPAKNNGVSCHALLEGIFPTQRSNPGLPHCRQILYRLSHKGSPRILEWIAYPFSSGSSQPREASTQNTISRPETTFYYQKYSSCYTIFFSNVLLPICARRSGRHYNNDANNGI